MREVPEVREVNERLENAPAISGERDLIDVLTEQHRRIEALFGEFDVATDERRQSVWAELVDLLRAHEGAEGELVHPLARDRIVGGFNVVRDLIDEERKINELLTPLIDADVSEEGIAAAIGDLRDAVTAHARNEERLEFPQLREHLPAEQLRAMASAAARPAVPA
nr:hemerythrin domain-containing protein [Planosporangium flavigriseum]